MSKPKGQLRWWGKTYSVRVRFADGSRKWVPLPEGLSHTEAVARAQEIADAARRRSAPADTRVIALPSETLDEWVKRWTAMRERIGYRTVRDDRSRYKTHIQAVLGTRPVGAITTEDIEILRDALDEKVQGGKIAWTTAQLVWSAVKSMFKAARLSKHRELRVRRDDPTQGVAPPDRGAVKAKQFLFPSEFLQLVSCDEVPLQWRRMFVTTTYLMLRASELEALGWDDLDLEHGIAHIHRSVVRTNRTQDGETKSQRARRLAIEPTLVPLLHAMQKEAGARRVGRVLDPMPPWYDLAKGLRVYLIAAGITRPELLARGPTRRWITFHDLRATGITWMAVRGDDPLKIRQRVGHEHVATTERYIRVAEELRPGFGTVFPELPRGLLPG
ncbi:MAG: tyrosine-type recombinase/integrase [Deltaproteobacteria bacterium]|nr:tyrosine-type recombinase/integrase [Deltaproteobacteria bacterium]